MWFLLTLVSTLALASRNIVTKLGVDKQDPYIVAWSSVFFGLPIATILIIFNKFEVTDSLFWFLLMIRLTMQSIVMITLHQAFKYKSVSYIAPLLSLTPILTSIISYFIHGDVITPLGFVGMLITTISCIILYHSEKNITKIEDQNELYKATCLVVLSALFIAILDPIHPLAIQRSNVETYFFTGILGFSIIFTILVLIKSRSNLLKSLKNKKLLTLNIFTGLIGGIEALTLFSALNFAPAVALVSSIRSSNMALTSLGGFIFFNENFNKPKCLGIIFSVLGVILVIIS